MSKKSKKLSTYLSIICINFFINFVSKISQKLIAFNIIIILILCEIILN